MPAIARPFIDGRMNIPDNFIFCALDTDDLPQALNWARQIGPITGGLKLGMEFINSHGPEGIRAVQQACPAARLFIDLKFHDIPNTVAGAVRRVCRAHQPAFVNVHAAGGRAMMQEAVKAARETSPETKILAVTILTSMDQGALSETGISGSLTDQVKRLAILAQDSGLDGVVCSAHEIHMLKAECGPDFIFMVPGIRPAAADMQDQKRVMTPEQALQQGATHIVIGRPITGAPDPVKTAKDILLSLENQN